ncbi:MAG: phosphoglucosamine mutase [Crenarchaeota archaeon]|nr:phosphoglucosamine mutase [Thermoproteota archaeon]
MSDLFAKRKLFGTDGVRGIVNENFDVFFASRLAMAIASYFPPGSRALVGGDARVGNPAIYGAVLSALAACGSKVYDGGLAPTPAIQLAVRDMGFDYGVVVTASHNPPQWVGMKLILSDGIEAPVNVELEVERLFFENRFRRVPWHEVRGIEKLPTVNDHYVEAIKRHVDREKIARKGLRAVADCANSVAALTTPRLLKELGVKVMSVNADLGIPYRNYEPAPENLEDTAKVVKALNADFAVTHDGDGDRAIFIDRRGRVIPGDVSAVILIDYIARKRPDLPKRVVTAISTSHFLMKENVERRGITVIWTRVGFVNIARRIKELGGALAGFEDNGGFGYVPHQPVRDGGMSAALMAELLAETGKDLAELVDAVRKPTIIRTKVPLPDRSRVPEVYRVLKSRYGGKEVIEIDGLKVIADDYAFLVRPSGTEPIMRITVESWSSDLANELAEELKRIVTEVIGSRA